MDETYYLNKFQQTADKLNKQLFDEKQLELKVEVWGDSVVLKIQKKSWMNAVGVGFEKSIFFSVWVSNELIKKSRFNYNIHALKLRHLKGYSIKSREFAGAFRSRFKVFENQWPNVSVQFGPLTLMEGWVEVDLQNFESVIANLAYKFLEIQFIIDDLLEERKSRP